MRCERRFLAYSLYPVEAIAEACVAFTGHAAVVRRPTDLAGEEVSVTPRDDAPPQTCDEFFSCVLSVACEIHLLSMASP